MEIYNDTEDLKEQEFKRKLEQMSKEEIVEQLLKLRKIIKSIPE